MDRFIDDPFVLHLPVNAVIQYLEDQTGDRGIRHHPWRLIENAMSAGTDWHRLFRHGLQVPLHLNLGIPGIEVPDHPIEENPEVLVVALALGLQEIPVILSGELEIAEEVGLIDQKAMSNLRNLIRITS